MYKISLLLFLLVAVANAVDVFDLQADNFELILNAYKYIAILFYDNSETGKTYKNAWLSAATYIHSLPPDCEMAQMPVVNDFAMEIVNAHGIQVPSIKVFRRGRLKDYMGPYLDGEKIAAYLLEDAQPSVQRIKSLEDMRKTLSSSPTSVIFSLFPEEDMVDEEEDYGIDPWGQYQAAADALRGHAPFFVVSSADVMRNLKLATEDLPVVFMVSKEGDGIVKYPGEIIKVKLCEWILVNSSPRMGQLTATNDWSELYSMWFISSVKLKFILVLTPAGLTDEVLEAWDAISDAFAGQAIFSYMTHPVSDVLDYFEARFPQEAPVILAHRPTNNRRYKSDTLKSMDTLFMLDFVHNVVSNKQDEMIKSQPAPVYPAGGMLPPVLTAVGSTVKDIVYAPDQDVLLVVYVPLCASCSELLPAVQTLGRALQGEPRVVVAQIDAENNDIPVNWGVKSTPTLLWFRASDKAEAVADTNESERDHTSLQEVLPRPYWDGGYAATELVGFVMRHGSFDHKTLHIASTEQLLSLQAEEEGLRLQYEADAQHYIRNQGRVIYASAEVDYLIGETVFDGKRWHIVVLAFLTVLCIGLVLYIVLLKLGSMPKLEKPAVAVPGKKKVV